MSTLSLFLFTIAPYDILTSYPTIITASLFLIYLLLLYLAYLMGKRHGISYKRYSKDITRHNSKLKSIVRTCRILNVLEKRTRSFTKFTSVIGIGSYLFHLGD